MGSRSLRIHYRLPGLVYLHKTDGWHGNCDGGGLPMAIGRVLQFDHVRGYGFVAADDGGEDVFLHASVFDGDPDGLAPGTTVEFQIMAGDRGRKAFAAHLGAGGGQAGQPVPVQARVPVPTGQSVLAAASVPASATVPAAAPVPSPSSARAYRISTHDDEQDDDQMCDVLSHTEFSQELTELLLSDVPALNGQQVLEVRQSVLECAKKHGWVDI
ncbi:MAG: cold-shock protein [Trebonia sp.]